MTGAGLTLESSDDGSIVADAFLLDDHTRDILIKHDEINAFNLDQVI